MRQTSRAGRIPRPAINAVEGLLLGLGLLDTRPSVAQRDGSVEDWFAGRRIGVDTEVAFPLELKPVAGVGPGE